MNHSTTKTLPQFHSGRERDAKSGAVSDDGMRRTRMRRTVLKVTKCPELHGAAFGNVPEVTAKSRLGQTLLVNYDHRHRYNDKER